MDDLQRQKMLLDELTKELAHLSDAMNVLLDQEISKDIQAGKTNAVQVNDLMLEAITKAKRVRD